MREANVAAAGGRVRRVKDKECEMDQEQQEARQEESRALAGGRRERQRGGVIGERGEEKERQMDSERKLERSTCEFGAVIESNKSMLS